MSGKQQAVAAAIGSDDDDDDEATMATPEDGRHIAGVNRQALPTARQHQIAAGSERQAQPDAKQHQRAAGAQRQAQPGANQHQRAASAVATAKRKEKAMPADERKAKRAEHAKEKRAEQAAAKQAAAAAAVAAAAATMAAAHEAEFDKKRAAQEAAIDEWVRFGHLETARVAREAEIDEYVWGGAADATAADDQLDDQLDEPQPSPVAVDSHVLKLLNTYLIEDEKAMAAAIGIKWPNNAYGNAPCDEEEWRAFCEYRSQKRPSLSDYELSCRVFFCDKWRRSCTYAQFRMLRVESQHRSHLATLQRRRSRSVPRWLRGHGLRHAG